MATETWLIRLRIVLAVALPGFLALLTQSGGPLGLAAAVSALTAGLAVAVVAAALFVRLAPPATPVLVRTVRMREAAWAAAFLRLRDPDAPGRTRPRAPGSRSTAA
ncbi:DUF6412 domain-containing protein [Actinophytocola gossypii]|uniref:Uncharacterized protein n=1 Tax=Actinophytocola gossypii TaxID=2812003 RepID=A0ABT2J842_9PSEU|nr:DUF6412 domain-containing protein [Actinophytocola gossypii]MCT2583938.1 hypothetical protein [Actinophytocola gossypii]